MENLRDWVAEEKVDEGKGKGKGKGARRFKSSHCPKKPPSNSTFTRNLPREVPKELLPPKKPGVPRRDEVPPVGLKRDTDFVVSNAVRVILLGNKLREGQKSKVKSVDAQEFVNKEGGKHRWALNQGKDQSPALPPQQMRRYVEKKDYGKRPKYLDRVKEQIEMEQELLRDYFDENLMSEDTCQPMESMPDQDRLALIRDLKRKWGQINKAYQRTCGGAESTSKNRLKEKYEKEMREIEADIQLLSRGSVKVILQ